MAERLTPQAARRAAAFILANLPLTEVPGTGLRLHLAGPRSGLARLVPPGGTPYWAHAWPGGVALASHLAAHPEIAAGCVALDLGTGSGLVALAALRAGAMEVAGLDPDPLAEIALRLNAQANGLDPLALRVASPGDLPGLLHQRRGTGPILALAGDVFYDATVARESARALDAATAQGATALVGDIGRRCLPRERLEPLAAYPVRDLGDPPSAPPREGGVFRWAPLP
jgi:predicted nicotinamide N-methyase